MPIQKLAIEQFLEFAAEHPVFDVRSPGEYTHAHIPDAHSLPLFSDEERKIVGTAYKQQSREAAIKIGLDFFGVKMKAMVEQVESIVAAFYKKSINSKTSVPPLGGGGGVLVHCWRGGMRSAGVAWLLDLYGFKVYTLVGGYKAYRKWVLSQFEKEYELRIVGGYTGSGKTRVLQELGKQGKSIIDLEALANHKGSAFGDMGKQPGQEMFENLLAGELSSIQHPASSIYIEDESQRIGHLQIPMSFWHQMRKSPVYFMDIPFAARLKYITEEYGKIEKENLAESIMRIQKRLGGLETKNAIQFLAEDNIKDCFRILLKYYDKWYSKALHNRENLEALLNKIPCKGVDTKVNTKKIMSCGTVATS